MFSHVLSRLLLVTFIGAVGCGPAPSTKTPASREQNRTLVSSLALNGTSTTGPAERAFPMKATIAVVTTRSPQGSGLEVVVKRGDREIERHGVSDLVSASSMTSLLDVTLPGPGDYSVTCVVGGVILATNNVSVALVPAIGGQRVVHAERHAPPRFVLGRAPGFELSEWLPIDEVRPYRVEWRHDGAVVANEERRYPESKTTGDTAFTIERQWKNGTIVLSRKTLDHKDVTPSDTDKALAWAETMTAGTQESHPLELWKLASLRFDAPRGFPSAGEWELRLVHEKSTLVARAAFTADGAFVERSRIARTIDGQEFLDVDLEKQATPEDVRAALTGQAPWPRSSMSFTETTIEATPAELRTLARSKELTTERERFNTETNPKRGSQKLSMARLPHESPEEYFRRREAIEHDIALDNQADAVKRRSQGKQQVPALRPKLSSQGQPWSAEEHPLAGG